MNYRILVTRNFEKEAKRLVKKYISLKSELSELNNQLLLNPFLGTPIGSNAYKIRLAVKSKGKGKSGGMRVITLMEVDIFIKDTSNIFLLSIYDKSETANISSAELKRLIASIKNP
jgi:hypothetical protein